MDDSMLYMGKTRSGRLLSAGDKKLIDAVEAAYITWQRSPRSAEKVLHLHSALATLVQDLLIARFGAERVKVYSKGIGAGKEKKICGLINSKDVDIAIEIDGVIRDIIEVKMICSNFSQNSNNYIENLLGATGNLQALEDSQGNQTYRVHSVTLIAWQSPYFKVSGLLKQIETLRDSHIDKYRKLYENTGNASRLAVSLPTSSFFGVFDAGQRVALDHLLSPAGVDKHARDYLATQPHKLSWVSASSTGGPKAWLTALSAENRTFLSNQNLAHFIQGVVTQVSSGSSSTP